MSSDFEATLGWTVEAAVSEHDETLAAKAYRERTICKCGHPAKNHTSESDSVFHNGLKQAGMFACFRGKQDCPCEKFEPVLHSSKTREFSYKTRGTGQLHSLGQGLSRAVLAEAELEWLDDVTCDGPSCQKTPHDEPLFPLALTPAGRESNEPSKINVLFCADCRARLAASFRE